MARLSLAILLALAATARADDWPAFRGVRGDGISRETDVPVRWNRTSNILWKAPLPRPGNGSPIVSDGRVFVACAEDDRGFRRSLYCFDARDGRRLWVRSVPFNRKMPTHRTNPYCGSTPAANGERVVVWHGSAGLYCYDFEGKQLWYRRLGDFQHMWGYGSSPVIHEGTVFLNASPGKRTFVTAVSLDDGKTLWETEEPIKGDGDHNENKKFMGTWATPLVARANGSPRVLVHHPTRVAAYDPADGKILWSVGDLRGRRGIDLAYSSPVMAKETCVVFTGGNGPAMAVRMGGSGDVAKTHRVWRTDKNPQRIGTGIYLDGYLYCPNDRSRTLLQCVDAGTGAPVWDGGEDLGTTWGSVVLAGGHAYVTTKSGKTVVFKPNPRAFELVSENDLEEESNSTPAIAGGRIYIRTFHHLYAVGRER